MFFFILILLLGGPSAAKFAGNQLVNLLSVLNNPNEPTALKMVRKSFIGLFTNRQQIYVWLSKMFYRCF